MRIIITTEGPAWPLAATKRIYSRMNVILPSLIHHDSKGAFFAFWATIRQSRCPVNLLLEA